MRRWIFRIVGGLLVMAVAAVGVVWYSLRASLPQLEGSMAVVGIEVPVAIERDALGTPTITATDAAAVAYGIGFAHGQDRFFQMDLSRRLAAGELAALFGKAAIERDKATRHYRFRALAREVLAAATPSQRSLIEAYTRGVNTGLESLGARPFEYGILRAAPEDWRPEDSMLVVYAMWWDLQHNSVLGERRRRRVMAKAPPALSAFLYRRGTAWDAPNEPVGPLPVDPTIPTAAEFTVRTALPSSQAALTHAAREEVVGSNNWGVDGERSATGAALIANDMHLGLRVPAVWYRARLTVRAADGAVVSDRIGVTLPGVPALVAGSNGHIAWGFTNSYGDWSDGRDVPCDDQAWTTVSESIAVKGSESVPLTIRVPVDPALAHHVITDTTEGSCFAVAWLARAASAANLALLDFGDVRSVSEALALAPTVGIPQQNLVVGDRAGRLAWTILGRVPRGEDGERLWRPIEWRDANDHPRIEDPASGRIWSANARSVDGPNEAKIGADEVDTGVSYDFAARARQIRDGLLALERPATPKDMLAIQLDDRALLVARWRDVLLEHLDAAAAAESPARAAIRASLAEWNARASADSTGYRHARLLRDRLSRAVWHAVLGALNMPTEGMVEPRMFDESLWQVMRAQSENFLPQPHATWRDFVLAEVDAYASEIAPQCADLAKCAWGDANAVQVRHPLTRALPQLSSWLDMPTLRLDGDVDMPRVQSSAFGASERFAVSPGHEAEGYLQIAGGQSGHPLSPFYRAGFDAWARGEPTPFLPGPAQHKLELTPARAAR
jgi:penicillin amidase